MARADRFLEWLVGEIGAAEPGVSVYPLRGAWVHKVEGGYEVGYGRKISRVHETPRDAAVWLLAHAGEGDDV